MFFDKIEIINNKALNVCGIESITIDIDKPILIIIGDNGSGKSSLVREFTPWPATQTDYNKGSKRLLISHQDKRYTVLSNFKKGIEHKFIDSETKENLNIGGTGLHQKELCEEHFQLNPFVNNIINLNYRITKMVATDRRNLFFSAYPFMNEILNKHKKLVSLIRSHQTNLKMLTSRKTELLTEQMNKEDVDKLTFKYETIKKQLIELDKLLYSLISEDKKLISSKISIETSPFFSVLNRAEVLKLCQVNNRSIDNLAKVIDPQYRPILDHQKVVNNVHTEKSILEYQLQNTESYIKTIREEINKFESYLNTNVEEEKVILTNSIATWTKSLAELHIDFNIPFIDKENITYIENVVSELEQRIVSIKSHNNNLLTSSVLYRAQNAIQVYSANISDIKRQLAFYEEELTKHINIAFSLPPMDCNHIGCDLRDSAISMQNSTNRSIDNIKEKMRILLDDKEILLRRLTKLEVFVETTLMCESDIQRIENLFRHFSWSSYVLGNKSVIQVLNSDPFSIINKLNLLIRNTRFKLHKENYETLLTEAQFKLDIINKTPSKQMIDESLLNRKVQLEKLLIEHDDVKKKLAQTILDHNHLSALSDINQSLTLLKQQWDVYSEYRIIEETLDWNREFISKFKMIKNDLTDNLVKIETIIQKQQNINIRLKDEINPAIEQIEKILKKYLLMEKALSPSGGIPKPNMIEFINNTINDVNFYVSSILQMDDLEVLPLDINSETINYMFPVKRNDCVISDISKCSKAQQNIIDLCWNLSLYQQLGLNNLYPLIMDEPDDGFSDGNRTRLLMLLSSLVNDGHIHQLILISHFASMLSGFENSNIVCLAEDNILLPVTYNTCCKII